ncbi:MAG: PEP-CTERM sorting domain-containing protein [Burkholderiaceae bacterium]
MKVATLLQLVFVSLLSLSAQASVIPQTFFSLTSDPGDPVGLGQSYFFEPPATHFVVNTPDAPISNISFFVDPGLGFPSSGGFFSSGDVNTPLAVGQYDDASNAPGHPSLDMFVENRFPINPTGWFHIYDLTFTSIGSVQSLAMTFEQHSDGLVPALHGALLVNSTFDLPDTAAVPEPGTLALMFAGFGLLGFTARRKFDRNAKDSHKYSAYLPSPSLIMSPQLAC